MNTIDITSKEKDILLNIFAKHKEIDKVIAFGSRVKNKTRRRSDLDLAIILNTLSKSNLGNLFVDLEESDLPFNCDIINYEKIENMRLKHDVKNDGVVLYVR